MEDRAFFTAIVISFILHTAFFVRFYIFQKPYELWKKTPEVTYALDKPKPKEEPARKAEPQVRAHTEMPLPAERVIPAGVPQPPAEMPMRSEPGFADTFKMFDRAPEKLKSGKVTKEVAMPILKSDKINTPSYVTYYQIVRQRIYDRACTNYTKLSAGEVYITFIIKSDGALGEIKVIEEKTTANDFLRETGMKSVTEAGPFPPFPQDLNYPELTFNAQISFQFREE
ncbi:MAG: hypothetical protein HQL19_03580 [Candidatus Omnitrophica bacterium]|nr:hypothetical protein [Candidatus Omnitrophota bacterium]